MMTPTKAALMLAWGLLWACPAAAGTDNAMGAVLQLGVPLPRGVDMIPEPREVRLGAQTLDVYTYLTTMDEKSLISFYEKALPDAGWSLGLLPWQQDHLAATKRVAQAVRDYRETPAEPKLRGQLEQFEQTREAMRRQLYASRGMEQIIVNIVPMEGSLAVFINHWSGGSSWLRGRSAGGGSSGRLTGRESPPRPRSEVIRQAGGPPAANVCCSGEAIPAFAGATLPFLVPRYPGARAMASSEPKSGERVTVFLMTEDPVEAVARYYHDEMPSNGWDVVAEGTETPSTDRVVRVLTYQRPGKVCTVRIEGPAQSAGPAAQTTLSVAVAPKSYFPSTPSGGGTAP